MGNLDCHTEGCPWTEDTCFSAALDGHLDVLKYTRSEGCPRDEDNTKKARQNNHIEPFDWAARSGCPIAP